MYVVDDIAYAGEPTPMIRVQSVRPLADYKLWVRFTTGEIKIFDFAPLLAASAFIPLKDKAVFDQVYVDYGCPVWNDGEIDIAPERLYEQWVTVRDATSA